MLSLEMAGLSGPELKRMIIEHCSHFGVVRNISILLPDDPRHDTVAAVEMSTLDEARKVLQSCGDGTSGTTVIMRLAQRAGASFHNTNL